MTVQELIEALSKCDGNLKVILELGEGHHHEISELSTEEEFYISDTEDRVFLIIIGEDVR